MAKICTPWAAGKGPAEYYRENKYQHGKTIHTTLIAESGIVVGFETQFDLSLPMAIPTDADGFAHFLIVEEAGR